MLPNSNVAEALVSKGFATVVRYRQDDDQRSSKYDELLAAEMKAAKSLKGVHDKKEPPTHRVADLAGVTFSIFRVCLQVLSRLMNRILRSRNSSSRSCNELVVPRLLSSSWPLDLAFVYTFRERLASSLSFLPASLAHAVLVQTLAASRESKKLNLLETRRLHLPRNPAFSAKLKSKWKAWIRAETSSGKY